VTRAPVPTARADSRRRHRARTSRADTRLLAGWLAPERSSATPSPRQSGHNPNIRTGSTHTRTGSTNTDTSNTGSQERSDALVFFGATGDLAHRKIFPALQAMAKHGDLDIPVIGVAKAAWTLDQLRPRARDGVERYGGPSHFCAPQP
jgi:Glucose-6-phosphate dehydrogenase, NAD binding domain